MMKRLVFAVLVLVLTACSREPAPVLLESQEALTISGPLSSILFDGNLGAPYTTTLTGTGGGTRPLTWSLKGGKLPRGLTLIKRQFSSSTRINGTPTEIGTFNFTVQAKDRDGNTATRAFTLTIGPTLPLVITFPGPIANPGNVGASYFINLSLSGGVQPYTWSIVEGQLPPGLTLNGNLIEGIPTTAGTYSFTIRVTDGQGTQVSQVVSVTINP